MRRCILPLTCFILAVAACVQDPLDSRSGRDPSHSIMAAAANRTVANPTAPNPSTQVPVQGKLTGTIQTTVISGDVHRIDLSAVGQIAHLGRATAQLEVTTAICDQANNRLITQGGPWPGVITAANGDEIHGLYQIHQDIISFNALGNFTITADLQVTGGTGRFANAAGEATAVLSGNVATRQFTATIEGGITNGGT